MTKVELTDVDRRRLDGNEGDAARLATRIIVRMAEVVGARRLIDVASAHIDGCLYHGRAGLDFAEGLARGGGHVVVPTTLNVGSLDLVHPELFRGDVQTATDARRLMELYVDMGCKPTWTCAPYQLPTRPTFAEHIAWAESNAIVFANSVLGARTNRYGDFIDICAAITGRVADAGFHTTERRRAEIVFRVNGIRDELLGQDVFYAVLGHLVGLETRSRVPVIEGLPSGTSEDRLKALGAAAASSGAVALFHAVGVTPEAPTLEAALQGRPPVRVVEVDHRLISSARESLSTASTAELDAVSLGTPHFSVAEFEELVPMLDGVKKAANIEFYVSTSRHVLDEIDRRGWLEACERAGVQIVVDTCTYITPILRADARVVMTNSAKWAYYAPGNLGVEVVFGSTAECVRSAVDGRVWRDERIWADP